MSDEAFRIAGERLGLVFWFVDPTLTRGWYVSLGFETLFGRPADELLARPRRWIEWVHPDDREDALGVLDAQAAGSTDERRFRIVRPDGSMRWVRTRVQGVSGDASSPAGVAAICEDVTEAARLEEELRDASRTEGFGWTAAVAHDFNNLLGAILTSAATARAASERAGMGTRDIDNVLRSAERSLELGRRLLSVAGRPARDPPFVDAESALEEVADLPDMVLGPDVVVDVRRENLCGWAVRVEPSELEQVVLNLVVNARDAMPEGGRFTLEAERVEGRTGAEQGPDARHGSYLRMRFEDTGVGMSPDSVERAMKPFYTTKPKGGGTGLGLAIVHAIAVRCGGSVQIDSVPGRGTSIDLLLPVEQASVAAGDERS